MSVKNMLSQIVFYRHISPLFVYSQCLGWRRKGVCSSKWNIKRTVHSADALSTVLCLLFYVWDVGWVCFKWCFHWCRFAWFWGLYIRVFPFELYDTELVLVGKAFELPTVAF